MPSRLVGRNGFKGILAVLSYSGLMVLQSQISMGKEKGNTMETGHFIPTQISFCLIFSSGILNSKNSDMIHTDESKWWSIYPDCHVWSSMTGRGDAQEFSGSLLRLGETQESSHCITAFISFLQSRVESSCYFVHHFHLFSSKVIALILTGLGIHLPQNLWTWRVRTQG